jgi:hypothetical protein
MALDIALITATKATPETTVAVHEFGPGQSCSRLSRTGDGWVAGTPAHVAQEVNADELGVVIDKLSHLLHFLDDQAGHVEGGGCQDLVDGT